MDYYRFELKQNSTLTLATTDVAGRVRVQIYADAPLIDESKPYAQYDVDSTADLTQNMNLPKGVYYIRITPLQGTAIAVQARSECDPLRVCRAGSRPRRLERARSSPGTIRPLRREPVLLRT